MKATNKRGKIILGVISALFIFMATGLSWSEFSGIGLLVAICLFVPMMIFIVVINDKHGIL